METIPDWIHVPNKVSGAPTVLSGTPKAGDVGSEKIQVTAVYRAAGHLHRLRHSFTLQVALRKSHHSKRPSRSRNAIAPNPNHRPTSSKDESDNRSIHTIRPDGNSSNDQLDQQQQKAQPMEGVESFTQETMQPSQISAFVSSLPFQIPFTPPIIEGRKDYLNLGQQAQISAAQQAQMAQNQAQAQAQAQESAVDHESIQMLVQRQQQNASQLTLSLPMSRRGGMSNEGMGSHSSQSPMSSMPQQMESTLPMASPNYPLGNQPTPNVTPGLSNDHNPTLSPALDLANFNPLGELQMEQ